VLPDGRRKAKSNKSQKVVRDWLQTQRQSIRDQLWTSDDSVTVGEFLGRYLKDVATPSVRARTLQTYRWFIRTHLEPALGTARLSHLTPQQIQSFYSGRLEHGLSPTTVLHIHNFLHKALEQAVRWGLVARNVTDLVDPPSSSPKKPIVWSADQARLFLEKARGHRLYALYVLAIFTGMRQGELLGLQLEDIDWDASAINVSHALLTITGEKQRLSTPKTEQSRRRIVLPTVAKDALERHCKLQERKQGYVFVSQVGTPLQPHSVLDTFKRLTEDAGLPPIRFHDLRHTCATLHLLAGTNPKMVQDLLGHSTIRLTLDTYSHIMPKMQDETAERMNQLLGRN
jgi:integrase